VNKFRTHPLTPTDLHSELAVKNSLETREIPGIKSGLLHVMSCIKYGESHCFNLTTKRLGLVCFQTKAGNAKQKGKSARID